MARSAPASSGSASPTSVSAKGSLLSTQECYAACPREEAARAGKNPEAHTELFREFRLARDHAYHGLYTLERQLVQDQIVLSVLGRSRLADAKATGDDDDAEPRQPWLVFTAGPMGAGKSHVVRQLSQLRQLFPLQAFVVIDPDEIKSALPENTAFLARDPAAAASLLHHESVLIAEICEAAALDAGADVLVDGSLRDVDWYSALFRQYRADFPSYQIAILHITAPAELVKERARCRALATRRIIPPRILDAAIEQTPRSIEVLSTMVDETITIDNGSSDGLPRFKSPWTARAFAALWNGVRGSWARRLAKGQPANKVRRAECAANEAAMEAARVLDEGMTVPEPLRVSPPRLVALRSNPCSEAE
jgi:hypothetical protein